MELVLQGSRRRIYEHKIKGSHDGLPSGTVAKDAVSVFSVKKQNLLLNGDYGGHISVNAEDIRKILTNAADRASPEDLVPMVACCLNELSKRADRDDGLLTEREDALLVTASSLVSSLSKRLQDRLAPRR